MTRDLLLELNDHPTLKKIVQGLGLPIPVPPVLERGDGPLAERPLQDADVAVQLSDPDIAPVVARALAAAGANPFVPEGHETTVHDAPGEAYGRPARPLEMSSEGPRLKALLFDASTLRESADLRALYDFFHPLIRRIARSGRVVIIGRPPSGDPSADAAQGALEGFVRSVAKEIGRRGATAQLIRVEPGAEEHLPGALRFFLSPRSAYITGQPIELTSGAPVAAGFTTSRPLEGQVALVTGAARGIGAATARRLAQEGAQVVCLDRPDDDGPTAQVAQEIGARALLVDVTEDDAPQRIAGALAALGGAHIVIHNAGVTRDKTLGRMKPALWDLTLDVNLQAVERITRALIDTPGALAPAARIVCLSSTSGIAGNAGQTNYAASKSGIIGYVRSLAGVLAERQIAVNAVAPGFIETRLTAAIPTVVREVGRRMNNLSQGGLPEDVAELILFLSSPTSSGLTGQVVRVCGGLLLGA